MSERARAASPRPSPLPPFGSRLRLQRRLELTARSELRHRRRGNVDALARARVHALARGALRGRELAEAGEVDRVAALQALGHDFHERLDGLAGLAVLEPALLRDLRDEILFRQNLLLTVGYESRPRGARLTT